MSLHAHLRSNTRVWHDRVDAAFDQFDLAIEPGYRSFLEAHSLVVPGLEQHLVKSESYRRFPGWAGEWRAPALWADLRAMGVAEKMAPVLDQNHLSFGAADPDLVGLMYVLEGSRLGGRVLARRVETGGHPWARAATRYLSEDGGISWRMFLDHLATIEFTDAETEAALAAAIRVFCAFEHAVAIVSCAAEAKNGNQT
jgi:heme oxygenase